ncbi:MAG: hypothetical protein [Caudoviricetes sp.]|nr:MAG: hypothetical protein [Caudoviricetes sp.]
MSKIGPRNDYASKMADKCQGIAHCLSYNEKREGVAKHILLEAAHFFDSNSIKVHKKDDGMLMVNARGKSRYMSCKERVAMWLLGGKMEIRP